MTARQVYEMALDIMNERDESGVYNTDIGDIEKNVLSALNIVCVAVHDTDCRMKGVKCRYDENSPPALESLDDTLIQHDAICRGVMPYGLAFLLLLEEEPKRAEKFKQLYDSELYRLNMIHTKGERMTIKEVY